MSADVQVEDVPNNEFFVYIDGEYVGTVWRRRPKRMGDKWAYARYAPDGRAEIADGFDSREGATNRLIRAVRPDVWRERRGPVWSLRYSTKMPEAIAEDTADWVGSDATFYTWRILNPEGETFDGYAAPYWGDALVGLLEEASS